jgi:hypothetical protein
MIAEATPSSANSQQSGTSTANYQSQFLQYAGAKDSDPAPFQLDPHGNLDLPAATLLIEDPTLTNAFNGRRGLDIPFTELWDAMSDGEGRSGNGM